MRCRCLLLACLAVLAACTPQLTMESGWRAGARPARPYAQVLVVAVSDDFDRRRVFENALVDELAAGGTVGTPSTRTMLSTDLVDKETVGRLVKATGAEAVLVTRLVHQDVDVKQQREREVLKSGNPVDGVSDVEGGRDPYYYNVYTYDFSVSAEPASLVINRQISVKTDLFEAGEGKLIYTVLSELQMANSERFDQNSDVAAIDKLASELARRLRRDKAVR